MTVSSQSDAVYVALTAFAAAATEDGERGLPALSSRKWVELYEAATHAASRADFTRELLQDLLSAVQGAAAARLVSPEHERAVYEDRLQRTVARVTLHLLPEERRPNA